MNQLVENLKKINLSKDNDQQNADNNNEQLLIPAVTISPEPIEVESKPYLLLLSVYPVNGEEQNSRDWTVSIGRQDTYEYLRNMIVSGAIDPNDSFILSGPQPIEDALTVFRFMKIMIDQDKIVEVTGFDINDYSAGYAEYGDKKLMDT